MKIEILFLNSASSNRILAYDEETSIEKSSLMGFDILKNLITKIPNHWDLT